MKCCYYNENHCSSVKKCILFFQMARKCLQISFAQPLPLLWHIFLHKYRVQILFGRSTKRVRLSYLEIYKKKNYTFPYQYFRYFEDICAFSEFYSSLVPVTFVLAFYVGAIVARWWTQWTKLPWPDNVAFTVNAYCSGLVRFR